MLDDIKKGQCPLSLSLSNVNECVSIRESKEYVKELSSKQSFLVTQVKKE